jgi:uncharacterized protein (TIGR03067 family)
VFAAFFWGVTCFVGHRAYPRRAKGAPPVRAQEKKGARPVTYEGFEGTWRAVSATINGNPSTLTDEWRGSTWSFRGETVVVKRRRGPELEFAITVDPKKSPKTIRLESVEPDTSRIIAAIYDLRDDTIKLGWNVGGDGGFPVDFETKPDAPAYLAILELVTEDKNREEQAMARREATRQLRTIALALLTYSNKDGLLPAAAICSADGEPLLSWRVAILPHLQDQAALDLYNEFHLDEPWDSPHNKALLPKIPKAFAPRDPTKVPNGTYFQVFVGDRTAFGLKSGVPYNGLADGPASTIGVVHGGEPVPWTKPADIPFSPDQPPPNVGGPFKGGFLAVMMDGGVLFISDSADPKAIKRAIIKDDGEELDRAQLDPKKK